MSDKTKEPRVQPEADQRGDTIISVLLSVIITSLVIVLAYALLSRSLRYSNQARERDQVKNLIQSQIEGLKNLAVHGQRGDGQRHIFQFQDKDQAFCLNSDGNIIYLGKIINVTAPSKDWNIDLTSYTSTTAVAPTLVTTGDYSDCEQSPSLASANVELSINYDEEGAGVPPSDSGDEEHLFTVMARWDRTGDAEPGTGLLIIPVRIHPLTSIAP